MNLDAAGRRGPFPDAMERRGAFTFRSPQTASIPGAASPYTWTCQSSEVSGVKLSPSTPFESPFTHGKRSQPRTAPARPSLKLLPRVVHRRLRNPAEYETPHRRELEKDRQQERHDIESHSPRDRSPAGHTCEGAVVATSRRAKAIRSGS
jgi:hypothetical protein